MTPYVESILRACPDARLILRHPDGWTFTLMSISETAASADFLSVSGVQIAGAIATGPDGSILAVAEPGHGAMVARARLAAMIEKASGIDFYSPKTENPVSWLESLHKLEDTRNA